MLSGMVATSKIHQIVNPPPLLYIYTMILIADSGSTKTNWCLDPGGDRERMTWRTRGINPFYQNGRTILSLLRKEVPAGLPDPEQVWFYGAGCGDTKSRAIVGRALKRFFPGSSIQVDSDLMATARSLCQREEGMVCILGTGSNSCYYDGTVIARHVPSLGYILGDEGSGADIGRRLVSDVLKNQLPEPVIRDFFKAYPMTPAQMLEQVYKNPFPNRFLAGFSHFAAAHIDKAEIRNLVCSGFISFFNRNLSQYEEARRLPVHFTGSIAVVFADLVAEAATTCGFKTGSITGDPLEGLVRYHRTAASVRPIRES
jgi:N-acetylglucosamine kinase-like BadF-type ATPase